MSTPVGWLGDEEWRRAAGGHDAFERGVAEGRRQAAAELIAERTADPHQVLLDIVEIAPDGTTHTYWSTHCRHEDHGACSSEFIHGEIAGTGMSTALRRKPAQCKHCAAPCVCPCHEKGSTD